MSKINIVPMEGKSFGATVTGVDVTRLSDEDFARIKSAYLDYGFLFFPDQSLTRKDCAAFGERFGKLEFGGLPLANQIPLEDGTYSEVDDVDTQRMRTNIGNEAWHSDSTYQPISSKCSMLYAVKVPDEGGQTELADMRAGYAALDEATKARIENLSAFHSTQFSQANDIGDFPSVEPMIYHGEAYLRPLVKTHPETGIKSLFVGRHAFGIPGLARDESRALLTSLVDFATSDETRVYSHQWTEGDLLMWDNRALLHRARPYDYTQPRVLFGTRVAGESESEFAYYPTDPEAEAGRKALAIELELLRGEAAGKRYGGTSAAKPFHT